MDISDTLAPNSDQLDAVDLLGGPQTFTITKVDVKQDAEQPVTIHFAEFPRPWRPGKSMRRVLAACWGGKGSVYIGRRVTLYCDESVRFGNDVVGGTRISHLSHLDKPKSIPLLVSRGKSATFKVQPLPDVAPPAPAPAPKFDEATSVRLAVLRAEWSSADAERKKAIESEVALLSQPDPATADDPTLDPDWGNRDA